MAQTNLDFTASDREIIARTSPVRRLMRTIFGFAVIGAVLALLSVPAARDAVQGAIGPGSSEAAVIPSEDIVDRLPKTVDPVRAWTVSNGARSD